MRYLVILMVLSVVPPLSHADTEWPYPEDTPKVKPLSIGMASDRPVDISRFLLARGASAVRINADSSLIAFVSKVTGRSQLWVMPTTGGQAKQLTYGNGITFYRWHPDGEQLIYGADNEGDEREAYYLISTDGMRESTVLRHSSGYRQFGAFNKDGSLFSYASTERNGRDFDIYLYDLKSKSAKMIFEAEYGYFPAAWHPDNRRILLTETRGEDANNLYLLDTITGQLETLFKPEVAASYENLIWDKDGNGFHFTSNQNGEMKSWQFYDLKERKSQDYLAMDNNVEQLKLCDQGQKMIWQVNQAGYSELNIRNLKNGTYNSGVLKSVDGLF